MPFSLEWLRAPEQIGARAALYLGEMLLLDGRQKAEPFSLNAEPSFPAIWVYDSRTDQPVWIECIAQMHLRDYSAAFPDRLNSAAKDLLATGNAAAQDR